MLNPQHGGNVWEAERKSRKSFDRFLDFSSNINPLGPPAGVRESLRNGFKKIPYYPDPEYVRLRKAISGFLGVNLSAVFVGNGLSQIIDLVCRSCNFNEAIIPAPAYSEYEYACIKSKIPVSHFVMSEKDDFYPDEERFYKILWTKKEAAIFFCNPNNPTGRLIRRSFFETFLKKISSRRHWLIVDEAFIDFTPYGRRNSLVPLINAYPKLIVLWSLTKIFSIPGLRLGVAAADKRIVERLQASTEPWSVNIMAQEAAMASLKNRDFLKDTRRIITNEREYLLKQLKRFDALKVYPSEANFLLIKILDRKINAGELRNRLFNHGILIRDCSNFRSLDRTFFRIAIKDRTRNKRFILSLAKCLA